MSNPDTVTVREVGPAQAIAMAAGGAILLDVREDAEWSAGHAEGAVHMPLGAIDPAAVPRATIVAVCRSGNRSLRAALILADAGHDVVNLAGGMNAWSESGLPIVTDDPDVGTLG